MSSWLIALVGLIYLIISLDLYQSGKSGLALAFFGYALSNVGLWLAARN